MTESQGKIQSKEASLEVAQMLELLIDFKALL